MSSETNDTTKTNDMTETNDTTKTNDMNETTTLELAGETFTAERFGFAEWTELLNWARERYMHNVCQRVKALKLGQDEQVELIWRGIEESAKIRMGHPYLSCAMAEHDGTAKVLHLSCRKHHPKLTLERITTLLAQDAAQNATAPAKLSAALADHQRE